MLHTHTTTNQICYTIERLGEDPDRPGNAIYKICVEANVEYDFDQSEDSGTPTGARLVGPEQTAIVFCTDGEGQIVKLTPPECETPVFTDEMND